MESTDACVFCTWGHGMGMIFGWIVLLAIIAVIVTLIVRRGTFYREPDSPIDLAKKRYTKGEITKDEFEQIKKDLH